MAVCGDTRSDTYGNRVCTGQTLKTIQAVAAQTCRNNALGKLSPGLLMGILVAQESGTNSVRICGG